MILNIALTGGPCAGKSTAMETLNSAMAEIGVRVVIAPEAATQIIMEGMAPGTISFQKTVFLRQLKLEAEAMKKAERADRVVVLNDRSLMDQLAYVDRKTFNSFLIDVGMDINQALNRYDKVVHLVSAAVGTTAYTTANNQARRESLEEAIAMEQKTLMANRIFGRKLVVVDNSTSFAGKMDRVVKIIKTALSEKGSC